MTNIAFTKMHGLGNDFVVIDGRGSPVSLTGEAARAIAGRHTGIGCDQIIVMERSEKADAFMRIFNADGGEVGACGNASRCVASLLIEEAGNDAPVTIETIEGVLKSSQAGDHSYSVNMGAPRLDWKDIPLSEERNTLHLDLSAGGLSDPVAVSMGNPHCVFFVDDAAAVDLPAIGPVLETHALFPERANIGIAQVTGANSLRLRVWERGAGITLACGTGACAAAVAAARRELTGRDVTVTLDGGDLRINWREDGDVMMTGPVATSFTGTFSPDALGTGG